MFPSFPGLLRPFLEPLKLFSFSGSLAHDSSIVSLVLSLRELRQPSGRWSLPKAMSNWDSILVTIRFILVESGEIHSSKPKQKQHPVMDVTGDGNKVRCCKNNIV